MIDQINPRARRDEFGSKINRDHSRLLAYGVPWLSILLFSLTPMLPVIAPAPVMPPLGYMMMLAWRLMRPGLLPLWAGLPLGAFDDLFTGQPIGSGVLQFSHALACTASASCDGVMGGSGGAAGERVRYRPPVTRCQRDSARPQSGG